MKEIDWSKAPEGATHHNYEYVFPWLRDGKRPAYFRHGEWVEYAKPDIGRAHINEVCSVPRPADAPAAPAWNGAGLPPVGTVCEDDAGNQVVIVAHHANGVHAIFAESLDAGLLYYGAAGEFRPLRTPEQIAAEEREKAIKEMAGIVFSACGTILAYDVLPALYDAGYRRQEPKE